jgi:probable rRNA maturation factor
MTTSTPIVDVDIVSADEGVPAAAAIRDWVRSALALSSQTTSDAEVSVRVVDESEIQQLNRDFRQQDKSTNVLSFPAGEITGLPAGADHHLGDIVVCAPVVAREAAHQGKPLPDHWAHMLVHGTLHLVGYDHESDEQATVMEALEKRVLERYGIDDPYINDRYTDDTNGACR